MANKIQSGKWLRFDSKLDPRAKKFLKQDKVKAWMDKPENIQSIYDPHKHTINFHGTPFALQWGRVMRDITKQPKITDADAKRRAKQWTKRGVGGRKWTSASVKKAWGGFEITARPDGSNK